MKYVLLTGCFACMLFFVGCNSKKKKNINDGGDITAQEFIDFYPIVSLPFEYSDTSFPEKENDSLLIGTDVFYKLTPDSTLSSIFKPGSKPQFYALGKFADGKEEVYLITKAITAGKKMLLLAAYDKKGAFIAQFPIIEASKNAGKTVAITIDPTFNITRNTIKEINHSFVQGNDVYVLNKSSKQFMLVMTDSLGEATGELINPIDTLPHTQKFSGDYGNAKTSLISLRDGQREGRMQLFMYLKKEKEGCEGEIKGEVIFTSPTVAEYKQAGDPCIIQFDFSKSAVKVKEIEGCGSRLGNLQCTFDGSYVKRKAAKTTTEKSK
ncbi:MAG: hypothetical protein ACK5NK_06830 [Niabella sp.]